jgi:UDP-N-acetylmuramoyl-L-alanyl-D-glutamate--2,6-diaminopimelate ligase
MDTRHPLTVLPDAAAAIDWLRAQGVQSLGSDSRRAGPGTGFVAWPGFASDTRRFVGPALASGAAAALVEASGADGLGDGVPPWPAQRVAALAGLQAAAGPLVSAFLDHPSRQMDVVAITGTNGKTSSAWWLAQALALLGRPCGVAGTLGLGVPPLPGAPAASGHPLAGFRATGLTTPDPVALQQALADWLAQGIGACALEASSIGLAEHRLDGTRIAVAVFTNFTQDHLDYHGSMDAYWQAKARLFDWESLGAAVVHVDDPRGAALARTLAGRPLALHTVSLDPASGASLTGLNLTATAQGMAFDVAEGDERAHLRVPFAGAYNASNLLGVVGALRALGVTLADAVAACARVGAVPGRMEPVAPPAGARTAPLALVDYAHTPDALVQALTALRPLVAVRGGRLHVVVGCGGDRDPVKRPLMAAAAERHADVLCLTSDNPRSEDPLAILAQMVSGLQAPQAVCVEPDRARAIARVLAAAADRDVVLIAGKGHESTQDIAGVKHPFSDVAQARAALAARLTTPTPSAHGVCP